MVVSLLEKKSGFFSTFFFTVNHFIYAIKNNLNFSLNSDNWLFRYEKGWADYFENIDITDNETNDSIVAGHSNILGNYPIYEYSRYLKHMYIYNEKTKKIIKDKKQELNITDGNYDSIFIRRGDKLHSESPYIPTEKYIETLLKKNPQCKTIFLQTDDYNSFLDLEKYIQEQHLNIRVITLCDKNTKGMIVSNCLTMNDLQNSCVENQNGRYNNKEYMNKIIDNLQNQKPVHSLNKDEIYEHTITMIIGLDIVLNSNICVCEYFSNISRFIKLMHSNPDNVFDCYYPNHKINMNFTAVPSYTFSFYQMQ